MPRNLCWTFFVQAEIEAALPEPAKPYKPLSATLLNPQTLSPTPKALHHKPYTKLGIIPQPQAPEPSNLKALHFKLNA